MEDGIGLKKETIPADGKGVMWYAIQNRNGQQCPVLYAERPEPSVNGAVYASLSQIRKIPEKLREKSTFEIQKYFDRLDARRERHAGKLPRDPVIEGVRADLLRRQQLGYVKYGGTLATNPAELRDKLQHAYEETLDLCNYLKWSIMQLDGSPELTPDPTHNTGIRK